MYKNERELNVIYNVCNESEALSESTTLLNPITKAALTLNDVFNLYNGDLESTYVISDNDIVGMIESIDVIKEYFTKKYVEAMSVRSKRASMWDYQFDVDIENQVSLYNAALNLVFKLEELQTTDNIGEK